MIGGLPVSGLAMPFGADIVLLGLKSRTDDEAGFC